MFGSPISRYRLSYPDDIAHYHCHIIVLLSKPKITILILTNILLSITHTKLCALSLPATDSHVPHHWRRHLLIFIMILHTLMKFDYYFIIQVTLLRGVFL